MYPVLLKVGTFELLTSGVFWFLGLCCTLIFLKWISSKTDIKFQILFKMALCCLAGGIIAARLGYVNLHWQFFTSQPIEILKFYKGGMVFYWGLAGGVLSAILFWGKKKGLVEACDIMFLALVPAQIMGRIGCFFHGCCFGVSYDEFSLGKTLLVKFPGDALARHPTQLYSAFMLSLIFLFLLIIFKRNYRPGSIIIGYIFMYGIFRFLVETIRADFRGTFLGISYLSTSQSIAVITIILIGVFVFARNKVWCGDPIDIKSQKSLANLYSPSEKGDIERE